jgi:EAL domain-containing protein (putative c-di-GMP-specific phosphodiesterase class I)
VELGRGLSLELVAEGIETPEQAAFFHSLGCRYWQGHGTTSGDITSLAGTKQKSA